MSVFGTRTFGDTQSFGGTYVTTRFFHVNFVTLAPLGSYLVVPVSGEQRWVPLGFHGPSALVAFVRSWGIWTALIAGFVAFTSANDPCTRAGAGIVAFLAVAAVGVSYVVARVSARDAHARQVYATFVGAPVDVGLLAASRHEAARSWAMAVRTRVLEVVDAEGRVAASFGYRETGAGPDAWQAIATTPQVEHVPFLQAALTLARLDEATARGAARTKLQQVHRTVQARLEALGAAKV